LRCDMAQIFV